MATQFKYDQQNTLSPVMKRLEEIVRIATSRASIWGWKPLTRFNRFCNNRARGQYVIVKNTEGEEYTMTLSISKAMSDKKKLLGANQQTDITKNFRKYNHSRIYIGKILLCGELLPRTLGDSVKLVALPQLPPLRHLSIRYGFNEITAIKICKY